MPGEVNRQTAVSNNGHPEQKRSLYQNSYICDNSTILRMTDNQIIEKIKSTAHEYLPDAEAMLFGSRARQTERTDSDYDILLVTNTNLSPKEKMTLRTSIRKALLALGIRSDILIQSKSEVDKKKNLPGHIVRRILKEAILI
jgi:predicted nucleotidyltransferase